METLQETWLETGLLLMALAAAPRRPAAELLSPPPQQPHRCRRHARRDYLAVLTAVAPLPAVLSPVTAVVVARGLCCQPACCPP
jgi:hypothetical protein